ncbi:MAG: hypothetical protein QXS54_13225 [Candidatus Methanomethylicaceae archaeon]
MNLQYQIVLIALLSASCAEANPFIPVDGVVSYNPGPGVWTSVSYYNNPYRATGAPKGNTLDVPLYGPLSSIVTLGDGGSITLRFDEDVTDDPRNPYGLDFIVFSNAFFVGGAPDERCQELAFVEISPNGIDWYLILPSKLPSELVMPQRLPNGYVRGDTGNSRTAVRGYAEYTPTVALPQVLNPSGGITRTNEELYTVPDRPSLPGRKSSAYDLDFDWVSGGGDAFDIADAVVESAPGVPARDAQGNVIYANLSSFRFVRITDALVGDQWPNGDEISAEIDAVADIRPAQTVGEAKALQPEECALITDAIVTAAFEGSFFVESPDRSAAIKVISNVPVQVGDKLTLTGFVNRSEGRFELGNVMLTVTSSANDVPRPLGMPIRNLSSDQAYGLLVRTWGRVTDPGDGSYCIVTDGAYSVKVVSGDWLQVTPQSFVAVTGICDREEGTGQTIIRILDTLNNPTSYE